MDMVQYAESEFARIPKDAEEVSLGFFNSKNNKFEIITDQPKRIKVLYERKRKEFDVVRLYWQK